MFLRLRNGVLALLCLVILLLNVSIGLTQDRRADCDIILLLYVSFGLTQDRRAECYIPVQYFVYVHIPPGFKSRL